MRDVLFFVQSIQRICFLRGKKKKNEESDNFTRIQTSEICMALPNFYDNKIKYVEDRRLPEGGVGRMQKFGIYTDLNIIVDVKFKLI